MTLLKKLALVASVALAAASSAHATGTYLPMDAGDPGDFENTWSFNSGDFGVAGAKNATFSDYFIFNVPDDEYVSFTAFGAGVTFKAPPQSTDFYGFALFSTGGSSSLLDFGTSTTAHSIEGGTWTLTSGTYELDLYGAFTKAKGTYDLFISGTPVPEPGNLALLMAGLGVVGLLSRRRQGARA